jgi:hypothetical protein
MTRPPKGRVRGTPKAVDDLALRVRNHPFLREMDYDSRVTVAIVDAVCLQGWT